MGKFRDIIRNVSLTTKLPCGKNWYTPDIIEYGLNDEIDIYPMSHTDEILMHNPDALFSNNAIKKIISSCVPAVKKPEKLFMPDVEVLLLAIKIATVGNELETYNVCSECLEKYNKLSEEERNKLIKDKKLSIEPQTYIYDARTSLEQMEMVPDVLTVSINKDLTVFVKPLRLDENTEYEINEFQIQNAIQNYIREAQNAEENADMLNDFEKWEENRNKNEEFNKLLLKLDEISINMLKCAIQKVEYKNEVYEDKEDILDLLYNVSREDFEKIKNTYEEASRSRINKAYRCKCKYCEHEWVQDNLNFNFSNFFVNGS